MPPFRGQQTHLAANDKFLALGIHNGKGDSNLILVLQVKYYNFWEKFIAFQGINCRKLQHIPLKCYVNGLQNVQQQFSVSPVFTLSCIFIWRKMLSDWNFVSPLGWVACASVNQ